MTAVYRRYRDFDWLFSILRLRYPACIIPPIPPKSALEKWYADDSDQILKRKQGLHVFLKKVTNHRLICVSEDLKGFLTEPDHAFEERKKYTQPLIDAEFSDEAQTYQSIAYSTISTVFSKASETLGGLVRATGAQGA